MEQNVPAVGALVEPTVRLCRDCRHSMPEPKSEWNLRCMHPEVNARDSWALASVKPHGSNARDERERKWTLRGLAPCGMRGALWAPKEDDGDITGKPGVLLETGWD